MPHLSSVFSFVGHDEDALEESGSRDAQPKRPHRRPSLKRPFNHLFRRNHEKLNEADALPQTAPTELAHIPEYFPSIDRRPSLPEVPCTRKAIPSLPRPQTFRRQESEKRERLLEVQPSPTERRASSAERRRERGLSASAPHRASSAKPVPIPSLSAPAIGHSFFAEPVSADDTSHAETRQTSSRNPKELPPLKIPQIFDQEPVIDEEFDTDSRLDRGSLEEEFDRRWILNLSMHFRDKSNREKFFYTFAERPNLWRRVTISLDYRDAPDESLESDLSTLHYQRDKSLRIYEAIRESLPDIQYYSTVTNLKLETTPSDGQLHVHVREDANETFPFPAISLFDHIQCGRFNESSLSFDSHLSGFVYKVRLGERVLIKKEIPGPDTVDEFLYEVNALDSLLEAENVVRLEGLVTDDAGAIVKGLLISYASQGALVDMIYDFRGTSQFQWHRREKWAKQIVNGLAEIHEAGFVQGDFTLSNIVIDEDDNAHIIDINRRGCPVGWEPPELSKLIESGQRIGMLIGVKTDLYQLGMVLWALAEETDEPERVERPLPDLLGEIPQYFRDVVKTCLSDKPQGRSSAKALLCAFPDTAGQPPVFERPCIDPMPDLLVPEHCLTKSHRADREYIDPEMAITIADVKDRRRPPEAVPSQITEGQVSYVEPDSNPTSTTYRFESSGSWVIGRRRRASRGRSPLSSRRRRSSPYGRIASSATSLSERTRSRSRSRDECGASARRDPETDGNTLVPLSCTAGPGDDCIVASAEHATPTPVSNKRLALGRDPEGRPIVELMHTDSGFDETMEDMVLECSDITERNVFAERDVVRSTVPSSALPPKLDPLEAEDVPLPLSRLASESLEPLAAEDIPLPISPPVT